MFVLALSQASSYPTKQVGVGTHASDRTLVGKMLSGGGSAPPAQDQEREDTGDHDHGRDPGQDGGQAAG
jgi:hypothetical protein